MGRTLLDTIGQLVTWADDHLPEIEAARAVYDAPGTGANKLARVTHQSRSRDPAGADEGGRTRSQGVQAEEQERLRHGSSFGAAAAAYAEHRPDYPEAAVRWALEPVWERPPVRVADIGAGTGKLTATLAGLGTDVTAVEPDPGDAGGVAPGDARGAFGAGERGRDTAA